MIEPYQKIIQAFEKYNTLFLCLPFKGVRDTGLQLPLFSEHIRKAINSKMNPEEAIKSAFQKVLNLPEEKIIPTLFAFVQFIERQILLFDALEDTFFSTYTPLEGKGTIKDFLKDKPANLLEEKTVRVTLTAHPTQFYSVATLGISRDLIDAVIANDEKMINQLLMQMGKTPFKSHKQPTPLDEANSLIWVLSEVFYKIIPKINHQIKQTIKQPLKRSLIEVGFWPGGDRDGNPLVTSEITGTVILTLRNKIFSLYQDEVKKLSRRLTFQGVREQISEIEEKLCYSNYQKSQELLDDLEIIRTTLIDDHEGLFLDKVEMFITVVESFGFHFVHLDLRQDASVHKNTLKNPETEEAKETLKTFQVAKETQEAFGEEALHRYIISNTTSHEDLLDVIDCAKLSGWDPSKLTLDIVPLFESREDLINSTEIMETLFKHPTYQKHLHNRKNHQTVMLGFSDGTKDGGYMTANWGIYQCRQNLSKLAQKYNITITFFDGRGGPPARGGGNTHLFYRAMSHLPSDTELTLQGQTITSKYGTEDAARYNLEQLLTAPHYPSFPPLKPSQIDLLDHLSDVSYKKYLSLKEDPLFIPYLEELSPLLYFGDLNIASRPVSRSRSAKLTLCDLRAIPFVGSWSQIKQNIPGYYGLGTALNTIEEKKTLKQLYQENLFFRTLINNCNQSLSKTNFTFTQHLANDKKYGAFWLDLKEEAEQTKKAVLEISGEQKLLEHSPISQASVEYREKLVYSVTVIQQFALMKLREKKAPEIYQKLLIRTIPTILNAARNSA